MQTYIDVVRAFIIEEFLPDIQPEDLATDYDLVEGGVVDSLGFLKIVTWVEERFQLPTDAVELHPDSFRSVQAISIFVERLATQPVAETS